MSSEQSPQFWSSRFEEIGTGQSQETEEPARPTSESSSGSRDPRPIFKWVRGEQIGQCAYGRVYLALNATTGEMIAVKQMEITQTAGDKADALQATIVNAVKSEIDIVKGLNHPNVVQHIGFAETPSCLSIFLEYVPGGSIGSCVLQNGRFDEEVTKSFTEQILSGVEYLHSKGIIHRDLKADNILVDTSGVCKISEFALSKKTGDDAVSTAFQGTIFWMAPEVMDPPVHGYGKKIDIWSVGCVVLEMWTGKRPWSGDEALVVILKLHKSKLPPPVPDDITLSLLADDFRLKCFTIDPQGRPDASELRRHPYLTLPPDWQFTGFSALNTES